MAGTRFGWADLYRGTRFLAPVSEGTLLDAGRAADLREGGTLLELACGNGAVGTFLAEDSHLYARGLESSADLVAAARAHIERSGARGRVRVFHEDAAHPDPAWGPADCVVALRGGAAAALGLLRRDGRCIGGRVRLAPDAPPTVAGLFTVEDVPAGDVVWRRAASPLEWERYFAQQERALRAYRARLKPGDDLSPIALAAAAQAEAFRAHAHQIAFELYVLRPANPLETHADAQR